MSAASPPARAPLSSPRVRRLRLALLGVGLSVLAFGALRCAASYPSDVHPWGTFDVCLLLQGDTCKAVDGGCFTSSTTTQVTLGVVVDAGQALFYRGADAPAVGRQVGTHVLFVMNTADGGLTQTVCGCEANVTETFWGELLTSPPDAGSCTAPDASVCGADVSAAPPESWLAGDAGIDPSVSYPFFAGTSVDQLSVAPDTPVPDGGCPCLPCQVVYSVSGSLNDQISITPTGSP